MKAAIEVYDYFIKTLQTKINVEREIEKAAKTRKLFLIEISDYAESLREDMLKCKKVQPEE